VHFVAPFVLLALLSAEEQPVVPLELQAELLGKVLRYDRQFLTHASDGARVLVLHLDTPGSTGAARQALSALEAVAALGGVAHHEELGRFSSAEALAALVKERGFDVVVLAPGLASQAANISRALDGLAVLTVSTTPDGVREGFVMGFDLVAGKPRMLFNLGSARRQHADFRAEVLQLMTVFP